MGQDRLIDNLLQARKAGVNPKLGCALPLQLKHQACLLQ